MRRRRYRRRWRLSEDAAAEAEKDAGYSESKTEMIVCGAIISALRIQFS